MDWHVTFYNQKVEDETLSFPKGILANLLHVIEMMLQFGPALGRPYTDSMGKVVHFSVHSKAKKLLFCIHLSKKLKKRLLKN